MRKLNKKKLYYIGFYIIFLIVFYYGKVYVEGYHELRERMYDDFEDFGTELEVLNHQLSQILVLGQYDFDKEKNLLIERLC